MATKPKHDVQLAYLHGPSVTASFEHSKEQLLMYDAVHDARIIGRVKAGCSSGGLPEGRNSLAKRFLEDGVAEWMLMIDTDMGFEPDILDKLLSVADPQDRPIIGGLCFANREIVSDNMGGFITRAYPTILNWTKEDTGFSRFLGQSHYPVNSVIKVGATGGAMLLIHRNVLAHLHQTDGEEWFTRLRGEDGVMMSEDVSFFDRCRRAEIPAFIHTGARTSHAKTCWVAEADFWDTELPPPATDQVAVIVPVLHRPQNVQPLIESLRASTGLATAYFVCDLHDIEEQEAVLRNGGRVLYKSGTFAEKANFAVGETDEPWLFFCGDDVRFHSGWLNAALDVAHRYDYQVVATNDCHNPRVTRGEHATHPLIERSYIERTGASWDGPRTVAHEGYIHMFVDDEWTIRAKQLGVFGAALGSRVEHVHPWWTGAETDEVYEKGQAGFEHDRALFEERLRANLGG